MRRVYRTKIPFRNKHKKFDLTYGEVFPVFSKFVVPGDIWKLRAGALIRYQPMLSPCMSECTAYFRFFFVPLRLVEDRLEEIITGSKEGSLVTGELPVCKNIFQDFADRKPTPTTNIPPSEPVSSADQVIDQLSSYPIIHKNSFLAAMGLRPDKVVSVIGHSDHPEYEGFMFENHKWAEDDPNAQAAYWYKAYCRIIWDYFRDENYQSFDGDFEKFYDYMLTGKYGSGTYGGTPGNDVRDNGWYYTNDQYAELQDFMNTVDSSNPIWKRWKEGTNGYGAYMFKLWFADLNKDYFMSALPWIMKGIQPTINSVMHADFSNAIISSDESSYSHLIGFGPNNNSGFGMVVNSTASDKDMSFDANKDYVNPDFITKGGKSNNAILLKAFNNNQITDGGFTAQDIRDMFAETRIFERLARTGSRYVEYLEANFGIAPRDDTLQRPQYLGGFTQPIVTTEVVQNGGTSTEVGTLRGHGISNFSNRIKPFSATEFGVIFGLMYVKPKTEYLFQERREFSYKKRFDFFNPSLQLLSEQQVKKSELFIPKQISEYIGNYTTVDDKFLYNVHPVPNAVLGYQGMYNELRYDNDMICRSFATDLSYWTQSINFADVFDNTFYNLRQSTSDDYHFASLNGVNICIGTFLKSLLKPFNADNGAFKPMLVDFVWSADCYRAMVRNPVPGLADHH